MNAGQEIFGAWTIGAATEKELTTSSPAIGAVWRWEILPNVRAAHSALRAQDKALQYDRVGIEAAIQRLSDFIETWTPGMSAQAKSLEGEPRSPEDAFAAALDGIRSSQPRRLLNSLQTAREEFDAFIQRVRELVSHYAAIETTAGGVVIARTQVSWTGDFNTTWRRGTTDDQIELHKRNVHVALARRAMLIRLVGVISMGAAKIILRLATPGAQLLVIPAIWQFICDVIEEHRRIQAGSFS